MCYQRTGLYDPALFMPSCTLSFRERSFSAIQRIEATRHKSLTASFFAVINQSVNHPARGGGRKEEGCNTLYPKTSLPPVLCWLLCSCSECTEQRFCLVMWLLST